MGRDLLLDEGLDCLGTEHAQWAVHLVTEHAQWAVSVPAFLKTVRL